MILDLLVESGEDGEVMDVEYNGIRRRIKGTGGVNNAGCSLMASRHSYTDRCEYNPGEVNLNWRTWERHSECDLLKLEGETSSC